MAYNEIPIDTLRSLLRLDVRTGRLYWLPTGHPQRDGKYAGKEALRGLNGNGYRSGEILQQSFPAHRVVFALTHGRWPTKQIDHIDLDRTNNLPGNLREATPTQNAVNSRGRGRSGYRGVFLVNGRWAAAAGRDGRRHYLGCFGREEDAAAAYNAFAAAHHGDFARLNEVGIFA
jgi:hypothetical protein